HGVTVLQKVDVRAKANARAEYDEVSQRDPGARGDRGKMEALKVSGEKPSKKEDRAAREALHGHSQEGGVGHAAMLRINRAAGPGKRSEHQNSDAARIHACRIAKMRGPDKQHHSGKAQNESEDHFGYGSVAARAKPVHNDQPERDHGHQQRRYPRGNDLFRPTDPAIPGK